MELITILDELLKKYKNNSKLSHTDELLAKQKLIELLNEDTYNAYPYVLDYPVNVGVQAYVEFYSTLDRDNQIKLNRGLLSCEEFIKNTSNKSVNKTSALLRKFMKANADQGAINFILKKICQLILDNKKHAVSEKNAGYVNKELMESCLDNLMKIDICKVRDKEFDNITTVFFETVFNFTDKINGLSRKQFAILKWIASANRKVNLSDEMKNQIVQSYDKWPTELKTIFSQMGLENYYKDFIHLENLCNSNNPKEKVKENQESSNGNENKGNALKIQKMDNLSEANTILRAEDDGQTTKNGENEVSATEKLLDVISYIESTENKLNDLKNIRLENIKLKANLEDKEKVILDLKSQVEEYKKKSHDLINTISFLECKITSSEKQLEDYKRTEEEYKKQIEALYSVNENEDTSAMEAFKNKVAGKLRDVYLDVKGTEELEMNVELGESLRFQFMDLFEELKRLGINL